MSDSPVTIEALLELCKLLLRRSDDALITLDAYQELLEEHGIISSQEFQATYDRMKAEYVAKMRETILKVADQHYSAQLAELLRSFEGPPQ